MFFTPERQGSGMAMLSHVVAVITILSYLVWREFTTFQR